MTKPKEIIKSNTGFNGRTFLTKDEWETYLKRKPVRYSNKDLLPKCEICNLPKTSENPLQNAHRIGFDYGIVYLALTPEFVDSHDYIVTAHKRKRNKSAELSLEKTMSLLKSRGIEKLPDFLPEQVHKIWKTTTTA